MCQRRRRARALQHQAALAEAEALHDSIVLNEPSLQPSSQQSSPPQSPPPQSTPPLLIVSRPVSRRLTIQAAGISPESAQSSPAVAESDAVAPSCPGSSDICCSQESLQEYKEQSGLFGRYPTPPAAPRTRKEQYIPPSESESEAESSDNERPLQRPPAKVFRNGRLMYHKAYDGPKPITYVDMRRYEGGRNDDYEAFNEDDLIWVRRIRDVLDSHNIPQRNRRKF